MSLRHLIASLWTSRVGLAGFRRGVGDGLARCHDAMPDRCAAGQRFQYRIIVQKPFNSISLLAAMATP
jgi:hypothetical protein